MPVAMALDDFEDERVVSTERLHDEVLVRLRGKAVVRGLERDAMLCASTEWLYADVTE